MYECVKVELVFLVLEMPHYFLYKLFYQERIINQFFRQPKIDYYIDKSKKYRKQKSEKCIHSLQCIIGIRL